MNATLVSFESSKYHLALVCEIGKNLSKLDQNPSKNIRIEDMTSAMVD
jgi:hypothetical protein